jgi:hypothetical protein
VALHACFVAPCCCRSLLCARLASSATVPCRSALVAVPGLQIGMLFVKVRDLGLEHPTEQGTGSVAQDFAEVIVE